MEPFTWEPDPIEDSKPTPMLFDGWGYTPLELPANVPVTGEAALLVDGEPASSSASEGAPLDPSPLAVEQ